MKEYVKFQVSFFHTWKQKLLICWFYINSMVIHNTLKKYLWDEKAKNLKQLTYEKMKISCCAKIPLLSSSGYVSLLPTYAFLFTLHLKIASEKALSCVIGSWVSAQLWAPLGRLRWPFTVPLSLVFLHLSYCGLSTPYMLEMSSQDAPLAFRDYIRNSAFIFVPLKVQLKMWPSFPLCCLC